MIQNGTDELYYAPQLLDAVRILYSQGDNAVIQTLADESLMAATDVTTELGKLRYIAAVKTESVDEATKLIQSDLGYPDELISRTAAEKEKTPLLYQKRRKR